MCHEKVYAIPAGSSSKRADSPRTMKNSKGRSDFKSATESLTITGNQGVAPATLSDAKAGSAKNIQGATAGELETQGH